jgi:hypothetical protein
LPGIFKCPGWRSGLAPGPCELWGGWGGEEGDRRIFQPSGRGGTETGEVQVESVRPSLRSRSRLIYPPPDQDLPIPTYQSGFPEQAWDRVRGRVGDEACDSRKSKGVLTRVIHWALLLGQHSSLLDVPLFLL